MAASKIEKKEKNMHNKSVGLRGEDAASKFLENKGYIIKDRN